MDSNDRFLTARDVVKRKYKEEEAIQAAEETRRAARKALRPPNQESGLKRWLVLAKLNPESDDYMMTWEGPFDSYSEAVEEALDSAVEHSYVITPSQFFVAQIVGTTKLVLPIKSIHDEEDNSAYFEVLRTSCKLGGS